MELAAIHLARALAWVEPIDLNPKARVFYPELAEALMARYKFQKGPQKIEDFDEVKGVTFTAGKFGDTVIEQFIIYTYGLVLDTRTSTKESKRLIEEAMQWGSKEFGLVFKPTMVKRWQYVSQVTFYSDAALVGASVAFQKLAAGVEKGVAEILDENLGYELTTIMIDYDQLKRKHPLGRFSIQRRENTPFSDNKYFSDAPLPTELHLKLLEQFEAELSNK
jgi:hypothetical protein